MTTTALSTRRDYLTAQRRTIIARALAASLAGTVPVPILDDWAVGAVLGGAYRRIAAAHHIDLDNDAVKSLVFGNARPTSIADIAVGGIMMRIAGLAAKRMMLALTAVNRARAASRNFVVMTLFDHYCARLHTGLALDGETALALRDEIVKAIDNTPGALSFHPFRRGALSAARATLKAPLELADLATRGAVRRLLSKKSEVTDAEVVDDVDRAVETALASKTGFLSRTVTAVELQLSAEQNPFIDRAIENLDRRWRARLAARGTVK
ncbi:MAG: hypothetical protein H0T89_14150 [Deltaproteobacteria bacterium]|nr:hypothetical protein [Deltaproteobacteria bacterium]MDQ3301457.1 hypothetical protein [Myxococcota bacterium]